MTWFAESPRPWRHAAAPALFAAAMLCKSIAVTLHATLLLLCWWKEGRVTGKDVVRLLPFFVVGLVLTTIDLLFYQRWNLSFDYTVMERTLMAAQSLWFYAGKLLWPVDLALLYPHWNIEITNLGLGPCHGRRHDGGGAVVSAPPHRPWSPDVRPVLRGDAVPYAGVPGLRIHEHLVRRRPLPVSGRHRNPGAVRRSRRTRRGEAASGGEDGHEGHGSGGAVPAGRGDLEPVGRLQG